jgi:N-acetylglucosaminyldiphosphoundecaprenol N-acetyl-beta-D-mannosaminyltransferase
MAMSAEETMSAAEGGAPPAADRFAPPEAAPPAPASAPPARVELFGVPVDALTLDQTVARCRQLVAEGGVHQHVVLNAAKVVELTQNEDLRAVIASCDVINADGASVVWAGRALGRRLPERVAGIDLFEALVGAAAEDGRSVYFLGARADVVAKVVAVMQERHPGLKVTGSRDGFWQDDAEVVAAVRAAEPDYLFLAIPSPRKEFWLHRWLDQLGVPLVMGVGGSFDVVTGTTTRAPRLMQRAGLEWAWRLGQEPRRMWKRYLVGNSKFVWLTAREAVKGRRERQG